ncbi:DUF4262 domain-containing protein [Niabella hirudinis]|uniref:DUF4262 domain-containing protein n=1 Tax=Niabella hirudinis TaxID=1285929 RepID=UPI003EBF12E0
MSSENDYNCRDNNKIIASIEKRGLAVIMLDATDYLPSFAYSIGLWRTFQHPEIICFGLTTKTLGQLTNDVADLVRNGHTIEINRDYDNFFEKGRVQFVPVDKRNLSDYFGTAMDIYDTHDFPALQFVWADRNDKFPWKKILQMNSATGNHCWIGMRALNFGKLRILRYLPQNNG